MRSRKHVYISAIILLIFVGLGYFLVIEERPGARFPFSFGLDLVGGTELVYTADTSNVSDVGGAMESLKEVIERRVNIFGVSEPLVQTESAGLVSGHSFERLIVGLPGVTNIDKAIELIGQTPVLEFRLAKPDTQKIVDANPKASIDELFTPTGLTGRYLSRAVVEFNPNTGAASVGLEFDKDGSKLFTDVTRAHKGEVLAIILDGAIISAPVIVDEISDGKAEISGSFTPTEAKELVRNLNYGALPVPITLLSKQTIGATLGESAVHAGVKAAIIGFLLIALFLIFWYRLSGLLAVFSLCIYIAIILALFKLLPVTLTAAGIAGFIISLGIAVDANVLLLERVKEELRSGKSIA